MALLLSKLWSNRRNHRWREHRCKTHKRPESSTIKIKREVLEYIIAWNTTNKVFISKSWVYVCRWAVHWGKECSSKEETQFAEKGMPIFKWFNLMAIKEMQIKLPQKITYTPFHCNIQCQWGGSKKKKESHIGSWNNVQENCLKPLCKTFWQCTGRTSKNVHTLWPSNPTSRNLTSGNYSKEEKRLF